MSNAQAIIETLLSQKTPIAFHALGPSMNPTILNGDSLLIDSIANRDIQPGNIILYRVCDRLSAHRAVFYHIRTKAWFVVSDAALEGGNWIPRNEIIGLAVSVRHNGRTRRLDTRRARWAGLARFLLRPLRRAAVGIHQRLTK